MLQNEAHGFNSIQQIRIESQNSKITPFKTEPNGKIVFNNSCISKLISMINLKHTHTYTLYYGPTTIASSKENLQKKNLVQNTFLQISKYHQNRKRNTYIVRKLKRVKNSVMPPRHPGSLKKQGQQQSK
eukprot:TRINITY_DN1510_c0_g1_i7.p4 TRINITY_DN1510_c0_g1~~TRINITY_DN1510_c0_g1_i7.p4  ORF type:complete len:129 (-),score=3.32 TRINITY_DN1510_c0_g1_i7:1359-1745(-)